MTNPFIQIADEQAQAENVKKVESNPFIPIIDERAKSQDVAFRAAMTEARDVDPDAYAKQVGLSKQTGLPIPVVERNPDKVAAQAPMLSGEYDTLIQNHPSTTKFLSQADNAKYAKDDIEHLIVMEQIAKMNDQKGVIEMLTNSFMSGLAQINVGITQIPGVYLNLLRAGVAPYISDGAVNAALNNPAAEYYKKAAEYYAPEEMHQDPIELIKQGNGPQAARSIAAQVVANLPQQIFLITATLAGAPNLGLAGMGALSTSQATAKALDNGKSPAMAALDGLQQGGIEAVTERFGTVGIVKHWEQALIKSFGKVTAAGIIKDVGKSIAAAFFQEGAEETVASIGQDFSDYVTGNPAAMEGALQRSMNAFLIGGFSGGLVTSPTVFTSAGVKAMRASQDGKFWDEFIGTAKGSKLRERSPEKYEEFASQLLKDNGKPESIYVSHEVLKQFFQKDAQAFNKFLEEMDIKDQLAEAASTGKEFEISAAKFASLYAGSPLSEALRPDMRFSPGGMTLREQSALQQEYAQAALEMQQEYNELVQAQKLPPEIQSMRDKMILPKEAGGAGVAAEDADAQIALFMAGVSVAAKRRGVPVEEYVKSFNPVLEAGGEFVNTTPLRTPSARPVIDFNDPVNVQYRDLITKGGGDFIGTQPGYVKKSTGEQTEGLVMFNDPITNTTLVLKPSQLTPEAVAERIAQSRKQFGVSEDTLFQDVPVTPQDLSGVNWGKVNTYMKRKGYDFRGAEDTERIFRERIIRDGGINSSVFPDHAAALQYGSSKKKQTLTTKAKRVFGVTPYFEEAGYLTPEGSLLDFSGRKDGYVGPPERNIDHREIHRVYPDNAFPDDTSGTANMIDFMNLGNVRLQSDGADISAVNPLTTAQERTLARHVQRSRGQYVVDISDEKGNTVESLEYEIGTNPAKVIRDVREALKRANSKAQTDSPEFKAWFGDSKVVDDQGKPLVVYHGTNKDFSAFSAQVQHDRIKDIGFHFGTQKQANAISKRKVKHSNSPEGLNVKPVYLSLRNPLRLPDVGRWEFSSHIVDGMVKHLKDDPRFSADELTALRESVTESNGGFTTSIEGTDKIRRFIKSKGFDGIVYSNKYEAKNEKADSYIAFDSEQIKSAIGNSGAFDPGNPSILFQTEQNELGFFSKLQQVIDEKMPNSAPAAQILATLKSAGVKAEEMEWMGVEDFLKTKDKFTKQEVLDFIRGNSLQIKEVTLGYTPPKPGEAALAKKEVVQDSQEVQRAIREEAERLQQEEFEEAQREFFDEWYSDYVPPGSGVDALDLDDEDLDWTEEQKQAFLDRRARADADQPDMFGEKRAPVVAPGWRARFNGEDLGVYDTEDEAQEAYQEAQQAYDDDLRDNDFDEWQRDWYREYDLESYEEQARENLGIEEDEDGNEFIADNRPRSETVRQPKFKNYILPAGANYREVLLSLPKKSDFFPLRFAEWQMKVHGKPLHELTTEQHRISMMQYEAAKKEHARTADNYNSSHFDTPNIVAHFRLTERETDKGRTLFIEEIQSDWHQAGRSRGYKKPLTPELQARFKAALEKEGALEEIRIREYDRVKAQLREGDRDFNFSAALANDASYQAASQAWETAANERNAIEEEAGRQGVPDAPFKKTWHELAAKRILRMAVEEGYDALAWTTGEQQVERYENALRDAVDKIEWTKTDKGVQLVGYKKSRYITPSGNDVPGAPVSYDKVVDTTQKETELSDALGKTMAESILSDPNQKGTIEGDQIKISDTGMAGFYDRIIPQFLSKYTKKWNGNVGTTEVPTLDNVGAVSGDRIMQRLQIPLNDRQTWWRDLTQEKRDELMREFREAKGKVKVHSLPITQEMKDAILGGQPLFQNFNKPRGSVQFTSAKTIINLYKSANLSTFLHESAHVFMHEMQKLVESGSADAETLQDFETLKKWVGGDINSRASQEKLAKGFEAYLREGRAPSVRLVEAFRRFRDWLTAIYRVIFGLDVEINDEIRGVFDRLLASETEIEEAKQFYRVKKSLVDLLPVTPEQAAKVKKAKKASDEEALQKEVKTRLGIYLRLQGGKQAIREQAGKEIDAMPVYKAISEAVEKGGMDAEALNTAYGKDTMEGVRERHPGFAKKLSKADAAKAPSLAELAVRHGFESPEALVQEILKAPRRSEAVTTRAKQILDQKEKELLADVRQGEEVIGEESLHNEKSLTYLITEVELLSQRIAVARNRRPDVIEEKLYRSAADEIIAKKKLKEATRYDLFARAEQRYAKQAEAALLDGKLEEALVAKKKQLLNHALVQAAIRARDERRSIENFFKAKNYKSKLGRTENAFAQAAMDLSSTYKLGPESLAPKSPNALDAVLDVDEVLAASIPDWVRRKELPVNFEDYKDLTLERFRELNDAIRSILQYGSDEMKSIEAGEAKTLQEWVEASVATMEKLKDRGTKYRDESSKLSKAFEKIDAFEAAATLLQHVSDWMDGFAFMKTGNPGPFKRLYNKVVKAEQKYAKLREGVVKDTKGAWDTLSKAAKRIDEIHGRFFDIPGVPLSEDMRRTKRAYWTVNRMAALLLNTGNAGNLEAIKRGYGYTDAQIQKVASYFTAEELKAIQTIWDNTNSLFPELDETHFSIYNRHLPKVEAAQIQFTAADGKAVTLKGGYYPLIFDHKISDRAAQFQEDDMMKNMTQAVIRSSKPEDGMTYARTPGHSLPPILETHVWFTHLNQTARYISHARILRDLNRFTKNPEWAKTFKKKAGDEHYRNLRGWLQNQANPSRRLLNSGIDRMLDTFRGMSTAAILGFKTAVGLKQRVAVINAAQAMGRDKPLNGWRWIWNGMRQVDFATKTTGLAGASWKSITETSEYIKTRDGNIDREISDMRRAIDPRMKKITIKGRDFTAKDVQDFAFEWIKMNDRAVVAVVWTGAYNQYVAELSEKGATPAAVKMAAIAYADGIVQDTQASSLTPELSTLQTHEGGVRLFTMFMTSSINYGNRIIQNYRAWNEGAITNKEFIAHVVQEYFLMPYAAAAIGFALRPGDDEPEWWQFFLVPLESLFSFVPLVRDVFSFWNYGTDVGRSSAFEPLARAAKAAQTTGKFILGEKEFSEMVWDVARVGEVLYKIPALNMVKDIMNAIENME